MPPKRSSKESRRHSVALWKKGFELAKGEIGAEKSAQSRTRSRGHARGGSFQSVLNLPRKFVMAWDMGFRGILAAAMADLLQERMVDSRNVVEEAVWLDKRNSLFFLLLNILNNNRPFEKIPTSPTEEDEGLEEPLWKIVAARPPLDSSERQENAGASHVEMLAKAKEEGAAAVEKVARRLSEERRGTFNSWHSFWSFYRQVDKSKPEAGAPQWHMELSQLSQEPEVAHQASRYRTSRATTAASPLPDDTASEDCMSELPESPRTAHRLALVEDRNPLAERISPARTFSSFQDHKNYRKVLKGVTMPSNCPLVLRSGKEYRCPRRLGLSLSGLPAMHRQDLHKPLLFGASTARDMRSHRCRLEQKQAEIVSEPLYAIRTMASERPSSQWQPGLENWVRLRSWREERHEDGQAVLSSSLAFMKPEVPEVKAEPMAEFHRPWSGRGRGVNQADMDDDPEALPPLQRYAKVCLDCGLHPQQAAVGFLGRQLPFLELRGLSYCDEDLLALTAAFPSGGALERLDLGENSKISDRSVCPLLECVASRYADVLACLRLDRCTHIGRKCLQLLTRLIHGPMLNLQRLDISGVYVSIGEYQKLANAIERHEHLQEVSLAMTGISPDLSIKVVPNLVRNTRIRKLDLGYNHFDPEAFSVLGNSLLKGSRLQYLGLAKTASVMAAQPMSGFLEQLPADKSLRFLDLSDNMLDENAALMLEYGLQTHPTIELLDVSTNPLGQGGLGSLARLLSSEECTELKNILLEDVQAASDRDVAMGLFEVDPSGYYSLDLAQPGQRTLLRLLLSQLGGTRSSLKGATLTTSPTAQPAPFNVDGVRKKRNIWNVPTSGTLSFVLNLNDFLLKDERDTKGPFTPVVERMFFRRKRVWKSSRKTLVVLQKVNSLKGPIFDAFLMALIFHFQLTKDQVMAVYMNQGDKAKETLLRMLPMLMAPQPLLHAALNTDTAKDLVDFESEAQELMSLNLENPTGHYALRLEVLSHRTVAQKLLLLNRWQLHLWRSANLVDVTMDGKGKCMRNALLDGQLLSWTDSDWRLPASGQLTLDFVALYRPPAAVPVVAVEAWGQVLAALGDLLSLNIREGDKEDPAVRGQVAKVMWALRAVSSRVWLLTRQLRNLLCIFLNRQDRGDILVAFFLRCVDWPINGKCCLPKFNLAQRHELFARLGWMNLFSYGQPEMSTHTFDLAVWEQRRCFHTMVRLSSSEDAVNIKNPMLDKDANPNTPSFQPFVAGIPKSWDDMDNIPTQGLVQCTYNCAVDRQNLKARRRLASNVGGWIYLPDTPFDFWSCLEDVPPDVLKVVMFMIRTWKSTDAAFSALNVQPDNMLNHKEFVEGLTKVGCCKTRRPRQKGNLLTMSAGARGMLSPKEDEEDSAQVEAISSVFRYLDTSHDGDISRKEFETLERVWRELQQSMYELKRDLDVFYGSLQKAFEAIDVDESGAISFQEFRKCVEATHFDGPINEIFMFLDLNSDNEIDGEEFFVLETHSHAPPLPDFTDAKLAKLQRLFR